MGIRSIIKLFKQGNVCVTGLRGTGKDMLIANVVARRKRPYISNVDYKAKCALRFPLLLPAFDIKNSYDDFIKNDVKPYYYPYPEKTDIYVSDVGVYFPSQFCNELNRKYDTFPYFMALSRQLCDSNVHFNVQNLNRAWDKLREQSDIYIRCERTFVIFGLVFQTVTVYDNYDSCLRRVHPFKPLKKPISLKSQIRSDWDLKNIELKRAFVERNGLVRRRLLIYRNKSKYNTRIFKDILENGKKENNV